MFGLRHGLRHKVQPLLKKPKGRPPMCVYTLYRRLLSSIYCNQVNQSTNLQENLEHYLIYQVSATRYFHLFANRIQEVWAKNIVTKKIHKVGPISKSLISVDSNLKCSFKVPFISCKISYFKYLKTLNVLRLDIEKKY